MTFRTLRLEDIGRGDTATAGGKGANLGELAVKGFPVPPGFVVSARVCESFFRSIELSKEFNYLTGTNPKKIKEQIGKVKIAVSLSNLNQKLKDIRETIILVVIIVIILEALFSSLLLQFILARPIDKLVVGTKKIAKATGNYNDLCHS